MNFIPSNTPLNDFVITLNIFDFDDSRIHQKLIKTALGEQQLIFHTDPISTGPFGQVLFSGVCVLDDMYVTSTEQLLRACGSSANDLNSLSSTGNWVCLTHSQGKTTIRCDPFSLYPVFYFRRGNQCAVSNRFHLLIEILKSGGIALSRNHEAALPLFCPYYIGAQLATKETTVKEIFLLPIHSLVTLGDFLRVDSDSLYSPQPYLDSEYPELINSAGKNICHDISVIANNSQSWFSISGGHDSRVIYAALIREKLLNRVLLRTSPQLKNDFRTVMGLTNIFGGNFVSGFLFDTVSTDLKTLTDRTRSYNLGLYNLPNDRLRFPIGPHPELMNIVGGGGECYRPHYSQYLGLNQNDNREQLQLAIERRLQHHLGKADLSPRFGKEVSRVLIRELSLSDFGNIHDALDWHYLNFRNRFHFGNSCHDFSFGNYMFNPLMQQSLLVAANMSSFKDRFDGKILFDITASLVELLPRLEYDLEKKNFSKEIISRSPFNRLPLDLKISMDFNDQAYRNATHFEVHHDQLEFDADERVSLLTQLFNTSFEYLREDPQLKFVLTTQFREFATCDSGVPKDQKGRYFSCIIGLHDTWKLIEN